MEEILKLSNLTKRYGCLPALDDVSLSLTSGKIIGLLGPYGSGKTTMMNICAGVLTPTSGDVQICGKPVGIESKALVSYLPDRTYLRGNQTLREQLEMFEDFYADFARKRAEAMLADLRLDLNARFQTLSKGNREKVQLVLVMSRRAKLNLLDEPIGGVDPAARDYILNTIINNYDPSATVLISTHLISDVEQVLDSYIFVNQGKIIRAGSVDEAREETGGSLDQLFREVFRCLPNY